jgi:hypothetical protein
MATRLFHFSEDDSIDRFKPRSVRVPSQRPLGLEWLNGPLIWAIDDWHQPLYLFPRDCPRILIWCKTGTTKRDADRYIGDTKARIVAYIEESWLETLKTQSLYRYELPTLLKDSDGELRVLDILTSLREVWSSTLHASGIRLRNARGWNL